MGEIKTYTIVNQQGTKVVLSNYGAGINGIYTPDHKGTIENIVLGYEDLDRYFKDDACMGRTPGRYANRIARGQFTLHGITYQLPVNNGNNHLHGGDEGFASRFWDVKQFEEGKSITFSLVSEHMDQGYPGEVECEVAYSFDQQQRLTIQLKAINHGPDTIINLTNHTYFNLVGNNYGRSRKILDHYLRLNADRYLPTDEGLIPTGEIAPVEGTPMDFRYTKRIGKDINADFPALKYGRGYDSCWVVNGYKKGEEQFVAELYSTVSRRRVRVYSDQPGVQVYTGNYLGCTQRVGYVKLHARHHGVAIECQNFPDAPNHENFPSALLREGETYQRVIRFEFDDIKLHKYEQ